MRLTTEVIEVALSLANDLMIMGLFLTYESHIIACACVYISGSKFNEHCLVSNNDTACIILDDNILWRVLGTSDQEIVNVIKDFQNFLSSHEISLKLINSELSIKLK